MHYLSLSTDGITDGITESRNHGITNRSGAGQTASGLIWRDCQAGQTMNAKWWRQKVLPWFERSIHVLLPFSSINLWDIINITESQKRRSATVWAIATSSSIDWHHSYHHGYHWINNRWDGLYFSAIRCFGWELYKKKHQIISSNFLLFKLRQKDLRYPNTSTRGWRW